MKVSISISRQTKKDQSKTKRMSTSETIKIYTNFEKKSYFEVPKGTKLEDLHKYAPFKASKTDVLYKAKLIEPGNYKEMFNDVDSFVVCGKCEKKVVSEEDLCDCQGYET